MQAVILAGGQGTRLKSIIPDIPKPMAPVADKPFLYYILEHLHRNNITNIVLLTGYKSDVIEDYINNISLPLNIKIIKEPSPLGTGGAILNALPKLESEFYVFNGDTFFDIDLKILHNYFHEYDLNALIALRYSQDSSRYGSVQFDNQYKVTSFIEKNSSNDNVDCFINSGIYLIKKNCMEAFCANWDHKSISLENNIFPKMSDKNILHGLPMGGCFIDIGIPEDYKKANTIIPERLAQKYTPALFLDRDNVLIEDKGYTYGNNLTYLSKADIYMKNANSKEQPVIVVSNQSGVARGYFNEQDVIKTNSIIRMEFVKKGLIINDFYYCPYHIEGVNEKYKKFSYARKPYPGMILNACEKYRIDLANSLMIGDNPETDNIMLPYLECKIV